MSEKSSPAFIQKPIEVIPYRATSAATSNHRRVTQFFLRSTVVKDFFDSILNVLETLQSHDFAVGGHGTASHVGRRPGRRHGRYCCCSLISLSLYLSLSDNKEELLLGD